MKGLEQEVGAGDGNADTKTLLTDSRLEEKDTISTNRRNKLIYGDYSGNELSNATIKIHTNGVKVEAPALQPLLANENDTQIKKEETASTALSSILEFEQNAASEEAAMSREFRVPSNQERVSNRLQNTPKSPGLAPLISGPLQSSNAANVSISHERSHVAASQKEGSMEFNLHSVPVYSPQPVQPTAPVLNDPFFPSRPVRKRRESENNNRTRNLTIETDKANASIPIISPIPRPATGIRTQSTPIHVKGLESSNIPDQKLLASKQKPSPHFEQTKLHTPRNANGILPSPMPASIPLPPLSLPTFLQLELSSHRPPQSHIYRSVNADFPYESSRAKIERLLNFLLLPHQLEAVLWFGTLVCLDYWLYTFTILPLRLLKSFYLLGQSWSRNLSAEAGYVGRFVYNGSKRMWHRRHTERTASVRKQISRANSESKFIEEKLLRAKSRPTRHHKRAKSTPSSLLPDDKADILKGLLIIFTCLILLQLDASRMYHWVRGQAAIKLYVIYNLLEVCDRLLSAIGQDVLECLFSQEALERKPDGHSKILRPLWLFIVALVYTVIHAIALFYQVVTLNVAVNSYSNALVTLLMSNQFVEIKGTVFKKFEKENLFQLTCADIVERFQLWHMLIIIASRNIVETGGWNISFGSLSQSATAPTASTFGTNITHPFPPRSVTAILPQAFTLLPSLITSLSSYLPTISQVISPFVIVLGSEMLIDWLKHAYINKFNNIRPIIYGRFLDVLAKDYYTNAFGDQNLAKRFGLPVIPLSCLLIRACVQTYQMFVAAWMPAPSPSAASSLASIHQQFTASRSATPTSATAIIASKVDDLLYHVPSRIVNSDIPSYITSILIFLLLYLMLLACKLILGMFLLAYARARYKSMKEREKSTGYHVDGARRIGGWGVVEVDDDKRRWIYEDDPAALKSLREREARDHVKREQAKEKGGALDNLDKVRRYEMVAKRIW